MFAQLNWGANKRKLRHLQTHRLYRPAWNEVILSAIQTVIHLKCIIHSDSSITHQPTTKYVVQKCQANFKQQFDMGKSRWATLTKFFTQKTTVAVNFSSEKRQGLFFSGYLLYSRPCLALHLYCKVNV